MSKFAPLKGLTCFILTHFVPLLAQIVQKRSQKCKSFCKVTHILYCLLTTSLSISVHTCKCHVKSNPFYENLSFWGGGAGCVAKSCANWKMTPLGHEPTDRLYIQIIYKLLSDYPAFAITWFSQ